MLFAGFSESNWRYHDERLETSRSFRGAMAGALIIFYLLTSDGPQLESPGRSLERMMSLNFSIHSIVDPFRDQGFNSG